MLKVCLVPKWLETKNLNDITNIAEMTLLPDDNRRLMSLCGRFDEHLRLIEQRLGVEIKNRGNVFQIHGDEKSVSLAQAFITKQYAQLSSKDELTPHSIHLSLQSYMQKLNAKEDDSADHLDSESSSIKIKKKLIKPRGKNQRQYIQNIRQFDINFGLGPAGTGKTYLAVAAAVAALEVQDIERILLVRPAVEAGEHLGFLPGDLAQKIDPYLRPLFDALNEMIGADRATKLIEANIIEVAPLAYMRGRTLNDAFVILDEAQNTTIEQMKMFLTRMGFSSKVIITGDVTQIDLPQGSQSGLNHAIKVLDGINGIAFNYFKSTDVVRHPLVQAIVEAYHQYENKDS